MAFITGISYDINSTTVFLQMKFDSVF